MREVITRPIQSLLGQKGQKVDINIAVKSLLDQIIDAALVFDESQGRILIVNSAFLVLSAFSDQEVADQPLDQVFDGLNLVLLQSSDPIEAMLKMRNRPLLPVILRASAIAPNLPWRLLRVVSKNETTFTSAEWQTAVFRSLRNLPDIIRGDSLTGSLTEITQIAHQLFNTNLVSIYFAEAQIPELKKLVTLEEITFFPETLPSSDLVRLGEPNLWSPGKRVITDLHRAARMGGLSYVATIPLGEQNGRSGLFVVGGIDGQPPPMLLPIVELLGVYAGYAFEQSIRTQNMTAQLSSHERVAEIQTVIYDYTDEGLIILTPELMIQDINPSAETLMGYTKKEVLGLNAENILISPDRIYTVLKSAVEGIETPNLENVTLHKRNGQTFPAKLKVVPILKDGKIIAISLFISDISEHEHFRAQTRQLEQRALLGEFMGVFAHEVLNPINSISIGLQMMTRRLSPEDKNRELVSRMEGDCERLHHQMEALKNYAKPYEPQQINLDLNMLLSHIVERWRPRMERLNIKCVYQVPDNMPHINGDWRAMEQVFTNLISNALDAMREKGGILSVRASEFETAAGRPQLDVTISDNGPGIPDEIRERIFEPFVTTKPTGTGLGLPITKRIVTAHRGNITVNSFPGGTVFHVYLPVCEDGPECQSPS